MLGLNRQILNRIREQVPALVTVENASFIAPKKDIGKLLPACILSPGPGDAMPQSASQMIGIEDQEWDVSIIVAYSHNDEEEGMTEVLASKFMTEIYQALHGWKTEDGTQRQGFVYKGRFEPIYNLGWAIFPMTFSAKSVIGRTAETETTD